MFDTVLNQWGYDMVKLDFLYAAALVPRKGKTRGQVMFEYMRFLRELCGDKIILGCGVPLGCSFGLVDYCRVSSDVALKWEDRFLKAMRYRERVSTVNALASTVGRRHLNGRAFINDPDVFILRKSNNKLSEDQKYTLFMLNCIFGGLVFTSDNINEYDGRQMELFKMLFELKDKAILKVEGSSFEGSYFEGGSFDGSSHLKVCYLANGILYWLVSNFSDKQVSLTLPCDGLLMYDPSHPNEVSNGQPFGLRPYQTICIRQASLSRQSSSSAGLESASL